LGVEGAGVVDRVGGDVEGFKEGDKVYSYNEDIARAGFYAEYAAVRADRVSHLPSGLDLKSAGAMPADGITALGGLEALKLTAGEKLAIFGASGGIGHLAVQLAKRMGAKVIGIASGADGVSLVRKLGADAAIDGHGRGLETALHDFAPDGLDAALLTAGGSEVDTMLKALRSNARLAFPNGIQPEPRAPSGVKAKSYDGKPTPEHFARLNQLIEAAPFVVHVAHVFRLDQAAEAHRAIDRHHVGKMALKIAS
jgi:NADPH:quinone reductase